MYASFLASTLALTTVNAAVVKRDISPFPSDTPVGTVTVDAQAQASAYTAGLALSETDAGSDNVTADSIRLINFDGCSSMDGVPDAEAQIYSGWQQAQKIMALQVLKDGTVDFNTAGALEYLGASSLNSPRQGDMNTIFKNFATLTPAWWPFGWRVHVRCDDPYLLCSCGETAFAYTSNYDEVSKLARINFCPRYFKTQSLNKALSDGKSMPAAQKYDMTRYWETQGHVWTHELMHIDWVTGAYGPHGRYGTNEHVTDMKIQFTDSTGRRRRRTAYGPEMAKILARWPTNTGDYTIRNADNLALFMTSQYVQSQLDNAYPQYPLINVDRPDNPPTSSIYETLFLFNDNGTVTLNETNPLAAAFADEDENECAFDQDEPSPDAMVFSSFAPDSAYPGDYVSTFDSNLASQTGAPASIMTAPPSLNTSSPSPSGPYCIPFQDPDNGISGYCQCSGEAYFSFASGNNPCPYTSPGPASATINPATVTGTLSSATPPPVTTSTPVTSSAAPAPSGPVIGDTCVPNDPEWGCTSDKTEIIYCYCGGSDDCKWTSAGKCDGGSATCHTSGDGGNCGIGFGACC